ncbi:MAG TPA: T9SS type A sorting domain-containing protein [Bacteroidia bacterium]|nr:T9SS type A sorting domain-containing protein [Bacteroidia bacterium]
MKKSRILVLMHEDLVPPDTLEGYSDKEIVEWKTEYDVVSTLKDMGHAVKALGVYDNLGVIRDMLDEWKPHITFNLLEEFHGNSLFDYHVVSYLELKRQRYTGCNPRGLSKPINRNVSTSSPVTKYGSGPKEGRCEIVCGGAGAPFYSGTANAFVEKIVTNKNHFCKLAIHPLPNGGSEMCDSTFDSDGKLIDNFCITKPGTTGIINDNTVFYPLLISPNPVSDVLNISYHAPLKGNAVIQIFDINGREVLSKEVDKSTDDFEFKQNVSSLPKGLYSLRITVGNQTDNTFFAVQ